MTVVHGTYFSDNSVKQDKEFLQTQGLSEAQVTSVSTYLLMRLSIAAWTYLAVGLCFGALFSFLVFGHK